MLRILDPLVQRMARSGVARPDELRGCTEAEILLLESSYRLQLPDIYREYLERMGHYSGRLFTHDHMAVTYRFVLTMTRDLRDELGGDASRILGPGSLIIAGRLGEDFELLKCSDVTDTPVLYFNSVDRQILQSHPSVSAWLECWCTEAEEAIADGYFLEHPKGTRP